MSTWAIHLGDVRERLRELPEASVQTCITSPPYWGLRDYGHDGQIGLETTPEAYVAEMVAVFREVRRVLKDDGTLWLNLGDSYAVAEYRNRQGKGGSPEFGNDFRAHLHETGRKQKHGLKPKDLVGIPWRVAFALQADGWWLRQDIIWHKPNPMPESVTDRCTKAHEYVFLLTKSARYYYDAEAVSETSVDKESLAGKKKRNDDKFCKADSEGMARTRAGFAKIEAGKTYQTRNRRSVWTVTTQPYSGAHFAVMPEALVEPCLLAGSQPGDIVLDPFTGSGTVGAVAIRHARSFVGCELNPAYRELARERIDAVAPLLAREA